jgi:hypothetical protein
MGEIAADSSAIQELLQKLIKPTQVTVAALTAARQADLGVGSESASLTIKSGGQQKTIRVGNSSGNGRYLRIDTETTTYLVTEIPSMADSTSQNDWVDKTLVKITEDKINKVTVVSDKGKVELTHQKDGWRETGKTQLLDSSTFANLTNTLAGLMTQGLVDVSQEKSYTTTAKVTITVEQTGGEPMVLTFYPGKENDMVVSSARAGKYVVATATVDGLKVDPKELKPLPSPTPSK